MSTRPFVVSPLRSVELQSIDSSRCPAHAVRESVPVAGRASRVSVGAHPWMTDCETEVSSNSHACSPTNVKLLSSSAVSLVVSVRR
jgi:hypothetical protein